MKAQFSKYGPKHDYRGAHVVLEYQNRTLLGVIVNITRNETRGIIECQVRHFCGDDWPIKPVLACLEILERTYEKANLGA